jgi:hypothetical protein
MNCTFPVSFDISSENEVPTAGTSSNSDQPRTTSADGTKKTKKQIKTDATFSNPITQEIYTRARESIKAGGDQEKDDQKL